MQVQGRILLCGMACLAGLLLGSCEAQTSRTPDQPSSAIREDAVPFVRSLPMVAMAEPMVVEFDLPPPRKDAAATLLLGIRVGGDDGLKSLQSAQEVRRSGLEAELVLRRLDVQEEAVNVPLVRVESYAGMPARIVAVGSDGRVPGGWLDDVDNLSLQSAGLESADSHYSPLALAWAQDVQPGKCQLSIRLLNPPAQLVSIRSELLVAYRHESK